MFFWSISERSAGGIGEAALPESGMPPSVLQPAANKASPNAAEIISARTELGRRFKALIPVLGCPRAFIERGYPPNPDPLARSGCAEPMMTTGRMNEW